MRRPHTSLLYLGAAVVGGMLCFPSSTDASVLTIGNKTVTVEAGKTFVLPVTIDPKGEKSYTTRFTLVFSPDLLEVVSFSFGSDWLPVSQPRYDSINNTSGELIKTAGFPGGFASETPFGMVTFRAKSLGRSVVSVGPRSFVLDAASKNTLESRPQVAITVSNGGEEPSQSEEPLPSLPSLENNLFDVSLEPHIETSGAGLTSRVAPGEFLPLSVKLLNFGNQHKVDVTIDYTITDAFGQVIYHGEETVAVETTASFVKTLQIPFETTPGRYIARSSITYQDQVVPATTEVPFTVEPKFLGFFRSDAILYGCAALGLSLLFFAAGRLFIRARARRGALHEYADVPKAERIYYEIVSDTIGQMRIRAGDRALEVAARVEGLRIDDRTGRVLAITGSPAKVVADLVSGYEASLGKKVSFALRTGA